MAISKTRYKQKSDELSALRNKQLSEGDVSIIQEALLGNENVFAAQAAEIVAKQQIEAFVFDLLSAYDYFSTNGEKRDKGCLAKTAIVKALMALNSHEDSIYLRGVRCIQMEPVYGGQADTAADLRSHSLLALLNSGYHDVLFEIVNLLYDHELQCRMTAVSALAANPIDLSEMLLRAKCLSGDSDPKVIDNCFAGLLKINLDRSLPFVAKFLESQNDILAESAALALGETSDIRAFNYLYDAWQQTVSETKRSSLMLPIALTRQERAFSFLFETIRSGPDVYAEAAINACRIFEYDEQFQARLQNAVKNRSETT